MLSAQDVKRILNCGIATVYALSDAGELPPVVLREGKRKRMLRWRPETVAAFIEKRETK